MRITAMQRCLAALATLAGFAWGSNWGFTWSEDMDRPNDGCPGGCKGGQYYAIWKSFMYYEPTNFVPWNDTLYFDEKDYGATGPDSGNYPGNEYGNPHHQEWIVVKDYTTTPETWWVDPSFDQNKNWINDVEYGAHWQNVFRAPQNAFIVDKWPFQLMFKVTNTQANEDFERYVYVEQILNMMKMIHTDDAVSEGQRLRCALATRDHVDLSVTSIDNVVVDGQTVNLRIPNYLKTLKDYKFEARIGGEERELGKEHWRLAQSWTSCSDEIPRIWELGLKKVNIAFIHLQYWIAFWRFPMKVQLNGTLLAENAYRLRDWDTSEGTSDDYWLKWKNREFIDSWQPGPAGFENRSVHSFRNADWLTTFSHVYYYDSEYVIPDPEDDTKTLPGYDPETGQSFFTDDNYLALDMSPMIEEPLWPVGSDVQDPNGDFYSEPLPPVNYHLCRYSSEGLNASLYEDCKEKGFDLDNMHHDNGTLTDLAEKYFFRLLPTWLLYTRWLLTKRIMFENPDYPRYSESSMSEADMIAVLDTKFGQFFCDGGVLIDGGFGTLQNYEMWEYKAQKLWMLQGYKTFTKGFTGTDNFDDVGATATHCTTYTTWRKVYDAINMGLGTEIGFSSYQNQNFVSSQRRFYLASDRELVDMQSDYFNSHSGNRAKPAKTDGWKSFTQIIFLAFTWWIGRKYRFARHNWVGEDLQETVASIFQMCRVGRIQPGAKKDAGASGCMIQ